MTEEEVACGTVATHPTGSMNLADNPKGLHCLQSP
jgi:hypothetical protein